MYEPEKARRITLDELQRELLIGVEAAEKGDLVDGEQFFDLLQTDLKRESERSL
jgi:hypothetical protein